MTGTSQSSGNVIADRRYDYATAALGERDFAAAIDLLEQTLEVAPDWAPAWFSLGEAREQANDRDGAAKAYERAASLDRNGALGAQLRLARLGVIETPATAPAAHVAALFDQYAPRFEKHLVETLNYHTPEMLRDAIVHVHHERGRTERFHRALDLGCGTGLMGKRMKDAFDRLEGVDISSAMIAEARRSGLYARLEVGDIVDFLRKEHDASADLVLAADVFVYIGDLAGVFRETARALTRGGLFAFSLQAGGTGTANYALGADLRYAHSDDYTRQLARDNELEVVSVERAALRRDAGADVEGFCIVLAKP